LQPFDCELFQKIDEITSKFDDDVELKFYVGSYYWNQIPKMWKWELIGTPTERKEITVKGAVIILDTENKYRFDLESI